MTRRARLLAVALLALPGASAARGQQAGGINFVELFQSLDADNDQVITRGEVPESGRAAFDRLLKLGDANKDGKIDREEYRSLLERARESAGSAGPLGAERFRALDRDGDGKLSRDEFTGPPALFDRVDADKDGFVTRAEAARFAAGGSLGGPNQFGPRLKAMDRNNDGKISRDEFTGPPALFDRIDANKDGVIEPREAFQFRPANPAATRAATKAARPKPGQ